MKARRALVIAPRLPEFDRESGLLRVSHIIDMLLRRNWEVTFGCLRTPTDPERYARVLEQRGVETHTELESLDAIRDADDFELAILAFWHVAEQFLPQVRRVAPHARVIVDSVDLHFMREARDVLRSDAGATPGQLDAPQADAMMREINTYAAADAVLTVSDKEADLLNDLVGGPGLALSLPDTEELPRSSVPIRKRSGILFLGNFLHAPNRDAATYLCEEIVPRIDPALLAEHEISIVGNAAQEHMGAAAEQMAHVKTVGWVPSVLPYLNAARLTVVPLRYGAGTKRKIVQAMMVGTPTVTTSVGAEGLGVRDRREVLIADDPASFAAGIERLLRRPLSSWMLAGRARKHVIGLHGRATVESAFDDVLEATFARPVRPPVPQPEEAVDDGVVRAPEYAQLVARVREAIEADVPADAEVLVATRGDEGFLGFEGRRGSHFPRDRRGRYAGHHPADSEEAIDHVEELRAKGATHLVLPETAFWWLAFYEGLNRHLDTNFRRIRSDEDLIVYELDGEGSTSTPEVSGGEEDLEREAPAAMPDATPDPPAVPVSVEATPEPASTPSPEATPAEITPELLNRLQPVALPAASSYLNGDGGRRALVLGVYLAEKPNTAEHIAATLAASKHLDVHQRWVALGGEPAADGKLGEVTALAVSEPTPKYTLLNRLLADEDLSSYDFVITTDDDIVLPPGFLDLFLAVQAGVGFDLAQPARTSNSHVDHPIVLQQRGVMARRTLFVEIGPLVSFGRQIFDLVFPFDETNPMGWGFENVWAELLREGGHSEGIVDAVPVDHSIREPVAHYRWSDANEDRDRYLAKHRHLPYDECFQVLDVVGVER